MEAVIIKQKRKIGFAPVNNNVVEEKKQQTNLEDFLKETISGEELVKYVCDRLDEKYGTSN
jgi:hypothetical protein